MQSWEEILFDDRNKAYGSYQLRKKYTKYLFIGFLIAVLLAAVPAGIAYYESKTLNTYDNLPYIVSVQLDQLPDMEEPVSPPPPMEKKMEPDDQEQTPAVVDSVPKPPVQKDEEKDAANKEKDSILNASKNNLVDGNGFDINGNKTFYITVDNKPEFPGGEEAMNRFISQNIDHELSRRCNIEGIVFIQFKVTMYGDLRDISVKKSVHPLLDNEALRVVKMFPRWKPAKRKGRPFPIPWTYLLPISFYKTSR
jgi:protein TonB